MPAETRRLRNYCPRCGEDFNSLNAFDRHRVGRHNAPAGSKRARRCLTETELVEAGLHRDAYGRWRMPASENPFWKRFTDGGGSEDGASARGSIDSASDK